MYNTDDEGGLNNGLSGPADILEAIYTDQSLPSGTLGKLQSMTDSGNSRADVWAVAATVSTTRHAHLKSRMPELGQCSCGASTP